MKALKISTKKASELEKGELVKLKNMYRAIHEISKNESIITIENCDVIYTLQSNDIVKVGKY
jgi:hypothetical protein